MKKHLISLAVALTLLFIQSIFAQDKDELDKYVQHLKDDKKGPLKETGFLTAGSDFLYGQEYFEDKKYSSATGYFRDAVSKQKDNAFANYQLAISLLKQNDPAKKLEAQEYLDNAFKLKASLKERYVRDVAVGINAASSNNQIPNIIKPPKQVAVNTKTLPNDVTPPKPPTLSGQALVYGDYTCSQSVWNGPNKSPAYSFKYKGYFALIANGTYRWLDNGGSGNYKYDAKTGTITWLSGYLASAAPKSTQYILNNETAQITINFSEASRWECGCKK